MLAVVGICASLLGCKSAASMLDVTAIMHTQVCGSLNHTVTHGNVILLLPVAHIVHWVLT